MAIEIRDEYVLKTATGSIVIDGSAIDVFTGVKIDSITNNESLAILKENGYQVYRNHVIIPHRQFDLILSRKTIFVKVQPITF